MKYYEIAPIQFEVKFLGVTKVINSETKGVSFCFDKAGTYQIELAQKGADETFTILQKLMYLLFLPIIGLISGLSVYGESMSIFKRINPYLISQNIVLKMEADTQIDVTYIAPIYDKKLITWTKPSLKFSKPKNADNYLISDNIRDFSNCYLGFKRSFFAICFDVITFFMVIAFLALHKDNKQVFITFLILSLSLLLLCLLTLIFVKKKIEKVKSLFIKHNQKQ